MAPVIPANFGIRKMGSVADMKTLRRLLKSAKIGRGEISAAIEACTFPLTERGFTMLIVSCRRHGHWRKALEIFKVMKGDAIVAKGVKPNFYTYTSLISVCSSAGACTQGLKILQEMRNAAQENPDNRPDAEVFQALISACHRHCRYLDVMYLHDVMVRDTAEGTSKSALLYALDACGEIGLWDRAFKILESLLKIRSYIPSDLCGRLLACCANQGDLATTVELFLTMQMSGYTPDQFGCFHMMRAAAAASEPQMCMDLLDSMHDMEITVGTATYQCIVTLLNRSGLREVADDVFSRMQVENSTRCGTDSDSSLHWGCLSG